MIENIFFSFQNIFDSKKKIKAATVDELEHKLTTGTLHTFNFNNLLYYKRNSIVVSFINIIRKH